MMICFVLKATYWDRIGKRRELIVGLWLVTGEKIALVEWFKCIKLHTELLPLYSLHYRNLLCLSGEITAYGVENVYLTCLIKGIRRETRIKYLQTVKAMTAMGSSLQVYWRWRVSYCSPMTQDRLGRRGISEWVSLLPLALRLGL